MFQVWFSRINAAETLHSYNQRLGRPRSEVRRGILQKAKYIVMDYDYDYGIHQTWSDYFDELGVYVVDYDIDGLLRFAVYNSWNKGYHRCGRTKPIRRRSAPQIRMIKSKFSRAPSTFPSVARTKPITANPTKSAQKRPALKPVVIDRARKMNGIQSVPVLRRGIFTHFCIL